MTEKEFEMMRDALLDEYLDEEDDLYRKAVAEGRAGVGLGDDLPEIQALKDTYKKKAILLINAMQDSHRNIGTERW